MSKRVIGTPENTNASKNGIYKVEQVDHFWLLTSIFFFAPSFSFPFAFFSSAGGAASAASVISGQIFF